MVDRRLIVLMIIMAVYVFYVKPLNNNIPQMHSEIVFLDKSIAKEQFIKKHRTNIKELFPKYKKVADHNKSLMFSVSTPVSTDFSVIQNILKGYLKNSGMILVSMNWGEVVNKKGYRNLPIAFMAKGSPKQLYSFIKEVYGGKKLLRFEQINISKGGGGYRKKMFLLLNAVVVGYKMGTK